VSDLRLDLAGRRALITGAGQGLGAGIARGLADAGAAVIINDLNPTRAEQVAETIRAAGGDAATAAFDVTDWSAVHAGFAVLPPVDILVNNAGNAGMDGWPGLVPLAESDPADWEPFLRVNLYGVMHCTRAAVPAMIESGWGRVVTVLSDAARTGEPLMAAYSAAKAGAAGFSRSVAREVGRYGITVNCVALGTMRASADAPLNEVQERAMRRYPIRRAGLPDDVTPLVALLASDAGEWITGQTIPVNGGLSFAL
jgi:NAD(P)-dependent dehydrogenase (short-subunit alcohol dehydrogenase family)